MIAASLLAAALGASTVVLDGAPTPVRWTDGDTFRALDGPHAATAARLAGSNALEAYGPVHRWGSWTGAELLGIAKAATRRAAGREWACSSAGERDRFGRLLVSCPDLAADLVGAGLAMVFAVGEAPDSGLLERQREAQRRGLGMWAKGVPRRIVTGVHSAEEPGGGYQRLADTATGTTEVRRLRRRIRTCTEVCAGRGRNRSCLVYVPFARRYGPDRASCLRSGAGPPGAPTPATGRATPPPKKASSAWWATQGAFTRQSRSLTTTAATTTCGSSAGAKPTNQL